MQSQEASEYAEGVYNVDEEVGDGNVSSSSTSSAVGGIKVDSSAKSTNLHGDNANVTGETTISRNEELGHPTVQTTCANADEPTEAGAIMPRQYLIDRTSGTSKIGTSRPPCFLCFVPKPVVWLSCLIEQNSVFERLGKVGCFSPENLRARKWCLGIGLFLNVIGTLLTIYTCLAISTDYDVLHYSHFTQGSVLSQHRDVNTGEVTDKIYYYLRMGMRAASVREDYDYDTERVVLFEDMCKRAEDIYQGASDGRCNQCNLVSGRVITTLIVSLVMCFPSLTTDVLRLYSNYDCNCQKVFASFSAVISVGFAWYTIALYQYQCFDSFESGITCLREDGTFYHLGDRNSTRCEFGETEVSQQFWFGAGWVALATAGIIKTLDMLLNFAIPTPTICRDRQEQLEYEGLATKGSDD